MQKRWYIASGLSVVAATLIIVHSGSETVSTVSSANSYKGSVESVPSVKSDHKVQKLKVQGLVALNQNYRNASIEVADAHVAQKFLEIGRAHV